MAQDRVQGHRYRFQHHGLLIGQTAGHAKQLLLMQQHLLAPSSAQGLGSQERTMIAKVIIAARAGIAQRLNTCGHTIGPPLQRDPVAHVHLLHISTDLNHLAHHFMAGVELLLSWPGSGRDPLIAASSIKQMEIAATDAGKAIAYSHPATLGQRLAW
ncbi:hypothetical protein KDAU_19080 [Dictyobacter aurantiacus]|uniref:Uncharacterized protein n=1 Tax=Dictyobacter aurantiacus TaxID=1936993 RepID=A0A401ZCJ7_9CHLR|nr:hypothetical protein KDAU_19080 [Dictyobacter aurantiacus]